MTSRGLADKLKILNMDYKALHCMALDFYSSFYLSTILRLLLYAAGTLNCAVFPVHTNLF